MEDERGRGEEALRYNTHTAHKLKSKRKTNDKAAQLADVTVCDDAEEQVRSVGVNNS